MRRAEYNNTKLYPHSEGRHGLNLMGCRNTIIEGLRIELTGGDGISVWKGHAFDVADPGDHGDDFCPPALAKDNAACACVNLLVRDVVCDRNYRQGMSVMLAENLLVTNSTFSNTAGTPPAAGLDIEPDHPNYRFVNVSFRGCSFLGNQGGGIDITTAKMNATSPPISVRFEGTTIVGGAGAGGCGVTITGHMHPGENVKGALSMRDTHIRDTPAAGVCVLSHPAVGSMWSANFANLTLENVATTWPTPPVPTTKNPTPCAANAAPIVVGWFSHDVRPPWEPACWKNCTSCPCTRRIPIEPTGGLHIIGATVRDSHARPFISCGSPRFPNGTQYVDRMPEVVQNISFRGVVINSAKGANKSVCGGDLGPARDSEFGNGYVGRGIVLGVDCHAAGQL